MAPRYGGAAARQGGWGRLMLAGLGLAVALAISAPALAEDQAPARTQASSTVARLPADQVTRHAVDLAGRALNFSATAGAIPVFDGKDEPRAEIAFIAYQLDDLDRHSRPVTFVFNGGPGMASGWLHVGMLGPWRIPFGGPPSTPPDPAPNIETWLDFTDLVFIDPPGAGYSRILTKDDAARKRLWSVAGDVDAISEAIRRWLDKSGRIVSPKFILGESYGGFRGPRIVRALQGTWGVGVDGLILVSPLLDVHSESGYADPFSWIDRLPSEAATVRSLKGKVTRADLADVEQYALGDYLTDFLRGVRDQPAVARMSQRVSALTGVDPAIVTRALGRLDTDVFLREYDIARGRVGSVYDATIEIADPFPRRPWGWIPDPVTEAMTAPVTSAMMAIYGSKLNWKPDTVYNLANGEAFRQWDWGQSMGRPESLSFLQAALALDPRLRVLIGHGLFDLRTPYFTTARFLAQLPDAGSAGRASLAVYPGGHMYYSDDSSRAAFRAAARALYQPVPPPRQ